MAFFEEKRFKFFERSRRATHLLYSRQTLKQQQHQSRHNTSACVLHSNDSSASTLAGKKKKRAGMHVLLSCSSMTKLSPESGFILWKMLSFLSSSVRLLKTETERQSQENVFVSDSIYILLTAGHIF